MRFFFNDTATTAIYTLSLHDALPIFIGPFITVGVLALFTNLQAAFWTHVVMCIACIGVLVVRSEEHTSELQSRPHLVCRLLLEKKKKNEHAPVYHLVDIMDVRPNAIP